MKLSKNEQLMLELSVDVAIQNLSVGVSQNITREMLTSAFGLSESLAKKVIQMAKNKLNGVKA